MTEIMKQPASQIETMKLTELVEAATMCAHQLGSNIRQLGEVLCEIAKRYGADGITIVHEELGISREVMRNFMLVARGTLHEKIALGTVPYGNALRDLSIEEQTEVVEKGIPVIKRVGKAWKSNHIKTDSMPTEIRKQVFDGKRIRTESEQKEYVERLESASRARSAKVKKQWEIKGGKLVVNTPTSFTTSDLAKILSDMNA